MTETSEEEIILEPGDPGYVDPNAPPVPTAPAPPESPAPQDLTHPRLPGESDGDYALRTKGLVVRSESPTDIVPNTPQIVMSPQIETPPAEATSIESPAPEPD